LFDILLTDLINSKTTLFITGDLKMNTRHRARRFWIGLGLVLVVLAVGFGVANLMIPNWGSTPAELGQVLPGDELFTQPVMKWTHAITIDATPDEVWPWIIQMGDTRAGYYSYRFIEKAITAMAGKDVSTYYPNVNTIHPEWQTPPAGQGMIMDVLVLRDYRVNQYMVAGPNPEMGDAGLLWTWYLSPTTDGQTRLIVHLAIQIPEMAGNKPVEAALNLATFMMERKMMDGIKLHAEGGTEADWVQVVEALVWFLVLGIGLVAAQRCITQAEWKRPLWIGLAAVVVLFILTYLQPALWTRILVFVVLAGALVLDYRGGDWVVGKKDIEPK
jgi:hypothetical protein